ncbi:MAG: uroporphyrinogen-III synthase, partial [Candidatus Rokuibacteriota bacterium]
PPPSWEPVDHALEDLRLFTGVVFADAVGVATTLERLSELGRDTRALASSCLVAGSHEARRALQRCALRADAAVDAVASDLVGEGSGTTWLVVGSPDAQESIAATLASRGAQAVAPPVCTMTTTKWRADRLRELLTSRPVHAIVFAEPVEVRRLVAALDVDERPALHSMVVAAAGESTSSALREQGVEPTITMIDPSPAALARALAAALGGRSADERG